MANRDSCGRGHLLFVGRPLAPGTARRNWLYSHVQRGTNRFDASHVLAWRWFVFLPEYRSPRQTVCGREGRVGSEVSLGPHGNDRLSCERRRARISEEIISAVPERFYRRGSCQLFAVVRNCALLETRSARGPVGGLRIILDQHDLLELVRISERFLSGARCRHDRRLGTGGRRDSQAESSNANLTSPPL